MAKKDETQTTEKAQEYVEKGMEQWASWEKRGAEQAEKAIDEFGRLMKTSMSYSLELQAQMRDQFLQNTRTMMSLMSWR